MMRVLESVRNLNLEDCWIGAGFVRNKVWDVLHGYPRTVMNDVDVVYYSPHHCLKIDDKTYEKRLARIHPGINWSVKNQARMHIQNDHAPYKNCEDAIAHWPETATAVAVRLTDGIHLEVIAPYGLTDLFNLYLRCSPLSSEQVFIKRMDDKQWMSKWPRLTLK